MYATLHYNRYQQKRLDTAGTTKPHTGMANAIRQRSGPCKENKSHGRWPPKPDPAADQPRPPRPPRLHHPDQTTQTAQIIPPRSPRQGRRDLDHPDHPDQTTQIAVQGQACFTQITQITQTTPPLRQPALLAFCRWGAPAGPAAGTPGPLHL